MIIKQQYYIYTSIGNIEHNEYEQWYMPKGTHGPDKMFDKLLDNGFWSKDNIKSNQYIGFDLGTVEKLKLDRVNS